MDAHCLTALRPHVDSTWALNLGVERATLRLGNRELGSWPAGLIPERVELLRRQMPHEGAPALAGLLRTTWLPYLDRLPEERRGPFVNEVVAAYLSLRPADDQCRIWVDAVRLEAEGRRL